MNIDQFMSKVKARSKLDLNLSIIKHKISGSYKIYFKNEVCFETGKEYISGFRRKTYLIDLRNNKKIKYGNLKTIEIEMIIINWLIKLEELDYDLKEQYAYIKEKLLEK